MALLSMQEYLKKKKKDDELQHAISYVEYMRQNEIAPVKLTNKPSEITAPSLSDKKDKDEGLLDFFQKGAFEDGYQFGDVTKSILGTTGDAVVGVAKGIGSLGEGIVDLGKYGVAGVADVIGKDKYAEQVRKKAQENSVEEFFKGTDDYLDQYSVLGRTSDAVMQGLGQVGGIILTGGVVGALGAGAMGATVATSGLMGLSSAGSGMSEAYEGGATDKEALTYGISKGIIDAGSELIFGGLGKAVNAVGLSKGISSLDDVFAQKLSSKLSNQVAKNFAEFGVKASAEGFEEVIAGLGSAVAKKLTYMDEEELGQIVKDENLLEQFVVGTVTSGMVQSGYIPATAQGSLKEANETGTDFITGYTQNEQAVIDKEVENRIKERETDGKKLTNKEITAIEEQVKKDLDKGYIDIDTIESTLGGETYNKYKSLTEQEETLTKQLEELEKAPNTVGNAKKYEETQKLLEELKSKDEKTQIKEQLSKEVKEMSLTDRLSESYNEKSRRSQAFEADLTKYDAKQQEVIKKATESGILNNTNRTHEFVDMVAKISADKGVSFDFTNNAKLKETGFALEGKTVNGYVKDGNIAVNIDSAKALNTVVGHEITHVLEGTDLYTELQKVVKEFATTKGEYQTRYDALAELYKDVDGAVVENELTADLVGEYLFTDSDFVSRLSVEKPNIFQKIYEEIKYLVKTVTGSKEARELEKVKRAFDKAYRESSTKTKEPSSEVTEEGIPVVDESKTQEYTRENEVIYSLSNDTAYMDNAIDKNKSLLNVDSKVMEEAKAVREKIAGRMNEIKDKGLVGLPEDIEGNTFISNSSYGGTEENTTICPRSLASEAFVDAVSEYLGRPLTVEEQIYISQDLQGRSLTPECTYCYVATDRKAYRAFLGEYVSQRDAVIDKVKNNPNADVSRNGELYKEFLNGRKDTNPMYNRFKMWVNNYKNGKPMIDASHLANINKLMGDINSEFGAELKPQITDAMKYAQSASWAKKRVNYVAYNGHILKWKQDRINKLNSHYGLRMYSFSDFHPAFVLENMQMITDASVRGLKMLGYTKDTDFVEIFAPTGMNINISTFGFETSGNVYENNIIGAEWEKAKALREQHPNVGITFVATNDTLVEWGLSQDWIDVVIPFHLVRTGKEVAKAFKYTDYTSESSDTKTSDWKKGDAKYIPPTEHNNDKATYLSALEKNHLKPRFERFVSNPNYMKLVNECRLPASESKPVQPIFNEDASMRALAKLEANGYYQPIGGSVDRMYEIASEVAENMQAELSPTQYSLGEQSAKTGDYRVHGKDIALEAPVAENSTIEENSTVQEKSLPIQEKSLPIQEKSLTNKSESLPVEYAPLTEAEANERDAMQGDRTYQEVPPEVEAPYYGEESPVEVDSPFDERDIKDVGKREQKAYMYENPEVKPFFQQEAEVMLAELRNSIKGEKHFNDQLYYDTNGEQGWFGTKRETSEQIAYLLDNFKYTYKDIEKGLKAIIEDNGKENNAISKRIEFMLDERLREGYTDFTSDQDLPPNQDYIRLLEEKQITDYSDESWNNWLSSLAETEPPEQEIEAPMDEVQVLYSLEEQQQQKIAEVDGVVEAEETADTPELTVNESYSAKLENYRTALEGYKTAKTTIENAFNQAINKKQAEYNSLKRKDTNRASNLLTQIENLKLRKSNNVTTIDSKIGRVENAINNMVQNEAQWKQKKLASRRVDYHKGIVDNFKNVFKSKGFDFDKVLEKAKNKGTFASVDNTPQRFIEKTLGYKAGQILNDLTVNKVAQNESKAIKWLNSFTDKKSGLLAQISKEYGIKPRSKESASAQMYAEGFWVDDNGNFIKYGDAELAQDYPNAKVRENIKRLAKDERIRKIYDETLDMINASRTRNLYPEIPRRNNYFLHFREMDDTFSKLGIPFNPNDIRLKDLPTDINGMTADLKPGQPYFASANRRLGYKTTYDLVGGVERYLNSAKNQIYHIDDIQTLRALRNYIADTYGQAKGLESLDSMTEEEAVARIEEVYNSHLSTFAKFLNEEANVLAGKTSLTDRGLEGVIGRRGIQFLDTVNRQVGSNMVGGNISSALTNTVSMVQAVAKSNKFDATKAFAQTVTNQLGSLIGKTDGFVENNPMMIRRKGIEKLTKTPWESITDKGYLLMSAIDNVSSEFIARTKFNELTRKGMSEQQAHIEADKWASRILGDRSLGQQPQLYNSKMLGLVTKFQLEVRNQLDSQFYDTIQEAKLSNEQIENRLIKNMKTSAKVGSTLFQLAVLQHMFGQAFESVAGYNPAFDIIEAISQAFGWDDDEESEDTVLDNLEEGFLTLLGDLPYTSTFTGGRVPVASALPVKQFVTGKDSYGNEKSRMETIAETAPYYLMPTGYGQLKKTTQGLGMFSDEHPVAGSYTKSGNLRFPIEDTPANRVKSAIFGQYASENARDYFDNERSSLKEKQIQEYKDLDIPIKEYWEYREGLSKHDKLADKADYIASLDFPISKKNIMINNIADRKEAIDMTNYDDFSSFEEFDYATKNPEKYAFSKAVGGYSAYKTYQEALSDISADKDENGKTINGSRKEKVLNYINGLDADYYEKIILFKSEYNADDTYNMEIIEYLNNRSDISYEEEVEILKGLGFEVDADGTVRW